MTESGDEAEQERWEPSIGPKLSDLYARQQQRGVEEEYTLGHLRDYQKYAALAPIPAVSKGRHHKDFEHTDCTCSSCHFCRQCTEELKPRCTNPKCNLYFCGPCLANRFGQDASEMMKERGWICPRCLDLCNCSGSNCRRSNRGLEPTASLVHEAHSHGYSSVQEYLIVTALYLEGTPTEKAAAVQWLFHERRAFQVRPTIRARGQGGVALPPRRPAAERPQPPPLPGGAPARPPPPPRRPLTATERIQAQVGQMKAQLGFLSLEDISLAVLAAVPRPGATFAAAGRPSAVRQRAPGDAATPRALAAPATLPALHLEPRRPDAVRSQAPPLRRERQWAEGPSLADASVSAFAAAPGSLAAARAPLAARVLDRQQQALPRLAMFAGPRPARPRRPPAAQAAADGVGGAGHPRASAGAPDGSTGGEAEPPPEPLVAACFPERARPPVWHTYDDDGGDDDRQRRSRAAPVDRPLPETFHASVSDQRRPVAAAPQGPRDAPPGHSAGGVAAMAAPDVRPPRSRRASPPRSTLAPAPPPRHEWQPHPAAPCEGARASAPRDIVPAALRARDAGGGSGLAARAPPAELMADASPAAESVLPPPCAADETLSDLPGEIAVHRVLATRSEAPMFSDFLHLPQSPGGEPLRAVGGPAAVAFARSQPLPSGVAAAAAEALECVEMGLKRVIADTADGGLVVDVDDAASSQPPAEAPGAVRRRFTNAQLEDMLRVMALYVECVWDPPQASFIDAQVLKRLVGLEQFVDFGASDPRAQGQLIQAAFDVLALLEGRLRRLLDAAGGGGAEGPAAKWVAQELKSCWSAMCLVQRGVQRWGAALLEASCRGSPPSATQLLMMRASPADNLQQVVAGASTFLLANLMHRTAALLPASQPAAPDLPPHRFAAAVAAVTLVFPPQPGANSFWQALIDDTPSSGAVSAGQAATLRRLALHVTGLALDAAHALLTSSAAAGGPGVPAAARTHADAANTLRRCCAAAEVVRARLGATLEGALSRARAPGRPLTAAGARDAAAAMEEVANVYALASAVAVRVGSTQPLDVLLPCGWKADAPAQSLAALAAAPPGGAAPTATLLLVLSSLEAEAMVDIAAGSGHRPFSMRWALIVGSVLELPGVHGRLEAPFLGALAACLRLGECAESVDLWGCGRGGDARTLRDDVLQVDRLGALRAQLLAAAMLRGLLPEEQAQVAQTLGAVLTQPGALRSDAGGEAALEFGCRAAGAIVAALTVSAAAVASQPRPAWATFFAAQQTLAGAWIACLQSSLLALTSIALRPPPPVPPPAPEVALRAVARRSLLCGAPRGAPYALPVLLALLSGQLRPAALLDLPDDSPAVDADFRLAPHPPPPMSRWQVTAVQRALFSVWSACPYVARAPWALPGPSGVAERPRDNARLAALGAVMAQEAAAAVAAADDATPASGAAKPSWQVAASGSPVLRAAAAALPAALTAAAGGGTAGYVVAANAVAWCRALAQVPSLRGPGVWRLLLPQLLPAVVQHSLKPPPPLAPASLPYAVQLELLSLCQECIMQMGDSIPPVRQPGQLQPGPPPGAAIEGALLWYLLQQALLCALQALSDLLAPPPEVLRHINAQLAAVEPPLAVSHAAPGHCLFQVRKLAAAAGPGDETAREAAKEAAAAVAGEVTPGSYGGSSYGWVHDEAHVGRWEVASALVQTRPQGLLWQLLALDVAGVSWVRDCLPRLDWLLIAADAAGGLGGGGASAAAHTRQRLWLAPRVAWLKQSFDDVLSALADLGCDVDPFGASQLPPELLAEQRRVAALRLAPPPPRAPLSQTLPVGNARPPPERAESSAADARSDPLASQQRPPPQASLCEASYAPPARGQRENVHPARPRPVAAHVSLATQPNDPSGSTPPGQPLSRRPKDGPSQPGAGERGGASAGRIARLARPGESDDEDEVQSRTLSTSDATPSHGSFLGASGPAAGQRDASLRRPGGSLQGTASAHRTPAATPKRGAQHALGDGAKRARSDGGSGPSPPLLATASASTAQTSEVQRTSCGPSVATTPHAPAAEAVGLPGASARSGLPQQTPSAGRSGLSGASSGRRPAAGAAGTGRSRQRERERPDPQAQWRAARSRLRELLPAAPAERLASAELFREVWPRFVARLSGEGAARPCDDATAVQWMVDLALPLLR